MGGSTLLLLLRRGGSNPGFRFFPLRQDTRQIQPVPHETFPLPPRLKAGVILQILADQRRQIIPTLVPLDPMAEKRSRSHQQIVAQMINSLLRQRYLVEVTPGEYQLGYVPASQEDWAPPPPTTVQDALNRLAALAADLNNGRGP